jgi:hypothetical protein
MKSQPFAYLSLRAKEKKKEKKTFFFAGKDARGKYKDCKTLGSNQTKPKAVHTLELVAAAGLPH